VIRVNLLKPQVPFLVRHSVLCKAGFAQAEPQADFPQTPFKINLVPLYLATCNTLADREEGALLWELVRLFDSGQPKSEAILSLAEAELREPEPRFVDDIRIAWLTVLHAASGVCDAWGYSFWSFFGKTYPKALLAWAERDEINRKALERCAEMVRANSLAGQPASGGSGVCGGVRAERNGSPTETIGNDGLTTPRIRTSPAIPAPASIQSGPHTLYDSARAELSLPPKKPVRSVKADKKDEGAAMSADRYLTQSEVCSRLRISRKTLQIYRKQGRIQFRNFGHRSIRIRESELAMFELHLENGTLVKRPAGAPDEPKPQQHSADSILLELIPQDELPIDCAPAQVPRCADIASVFVTSSSGYQRRPLCKSHAAYVFAEWMVGI
jgi:excisionase family DNA binding protein